MAQTTRVISRDSEDQKAPLGRPLTVVADPFTGKGPVPAALHLTSQALVTLLILVKRQRERARIEPCHIRPRANAAGRQEHVELGARVTDTQAKPSV